jgi:hypothetical protein
LTPIPRCRPLSSAWLSQRSRDPTVSFCWANGRVKDDSTKAFFEHHNVAHSIDQLEIDPIQRNAGMKLTHKEEAKQIEASAIRRMYRL